MKYLILVIWVLLINGTLSAPAEDLVNLDVVRYNHRWYSGFLNFSMGSFHYVFFESQSNPQNDPVLLWLNGGPGCSSLIGMVTENGPFVFISNTTTLKLNPFSWNKKANVIYLESPGGVGFSEGKRGLNNDDGTVAEDNYQALLAFFVKFPEYKNNDFYMAGQSYAGMYLPYLSLNIINKNKQVPDSQRINLKGFLVGNACTDPKECYQQLTDKKTNEMSLPQYQHLFKHGFLGKELYMSIMNACDKGRYTEEDCSVLRIKANAIFYASRTSIHNVYTPCTNQKVNFLKENNQRTYFSSKNKRYILFEDDRTCEDLIGTYTFFNNKTVQNALHVPNIHYEQCSNLVGDNYTMFANQSSWIYPILMKESLRIWVYSGDADAAVPICGTIFWVNKLRNQQNLKVLEDWRPWTVPGKKDGELQVGGMVWKLQKFTLVSVRGAGHMVPMDRRPESFIMFDAFLTGKDLPRQGE